jgi:hypothetical protein
MHITQVTIQNSIAVFCLKLRIAIFYVGQMIVGVLTQRRTNGSTISEANTVQWFFSVVSQLREKTLEMMIFLF